VAIKTLKTTLAVCTAYQKKKNDITLIIHADNIYGGGCRLQRRGFTYFAEKAIITIVMCH